MTTERWLEDRRKTLGASDVPVVLGLSPWGSPLKTWAQKRGTLPPGEAESWLEWRKELEKPMAQWFLRHRSGWDCTLDPVLMLEVLGDYGAKCDMHAYIEAGELLCVSQELPILSCSPDGVAWGDGRIALLQMKTEYDGAKWREGPPIYYKAQAHAEMFVTGQRHYFFETMIGLNEPQLFEQPWDSGFAQQIVRDAAQWWDRYVVGGEEPLPNQNDQTTIDDMAGYAPGKMVDATEEVEAATRRALLLVSRAKDTAAEADKLKNLVRRSMGDAERMNLLGGSFWTLKMDKNNRKRLVYHEAKPER